MDTYVLHIQWSHGGYQNLYMSEVFFTCLIFSKTGVKMSNTSHMNVNKYVQDLNYICVCVCACVRSCGKVGVCEFVSEGEKARQEGEWESLGEETLWSHFVVSMSV